MVQCKTVETPLLMHRSYQSLPLDHEVNVHVGIVPVKVPPLYLLNDLDKVLEDIATFLVGDGSRGKITQDVRTLGLDGVQVSER